MAVSGPANKGMFGGASKFGGTVTGANKRQYNNFTGSNRNLPDLPWVVRGLN